MNVFNMHNIEVDRSTRHVHLTMHTIKPIIMPADLTDNDAKIAWRVWHNEAEKYFNVIKFASYVFDASCIYPSVNYI